MSAVTGDPEEPQLKRLDLQDDLLQKALISLVGDIAAYRPGKKVVIFEGGGDSEFDVSMVRELFPELTEKANVISSGNKLRVRELHSVLETIGKTGTVPFQTYSITVLDSETEEAVVAPRFKWDRYHIENYLLEPQFVLKTMRDLAALGADDEAAVYDKLRECAAATLPSLVRHHLMVEANAAIVSSLDLNFDPKRKDIAVALSEAVTRSLEKAARQQTDRLALSTLAASEIDTRERLKADLATDAWRVTFRGRDVLKEFVGRHCKVNYLTFRDLVVARMRDAQFRPRGMADVLQKIIES
jgi:hypothetical protein